MGWVIWAIVIGVLILGVANAVKNQGANNAALGVVGGQAYRTVGLNYLGGHPSHPQAIKACTLLVTLHDVVIEKGAGMPLKLPMDKVLGLSVETEAEARRRYTATRMLAFGVFALAAPKKTAGSALVAVDTAEGPILFEKEKTSKAMMLKTMGPSIAAINRAVSKRPASKATTAVIEPAASVADELTKLMALRDGGALTADEFEAQKALVLSGQNLDVPQDEVIPESVDVVLVDVGLRPIGVIKVIRSLTGLGLREAKEIADTAPATVMVGVSGEDGERACDALEVAGATCEIQETSLD